VLVGVWADVSNEEASLRRVLARCRRLATLILSHCPVSDDVLSAFVPFGPTLRVLVLSSWYDRVRVRVRVHVRVR
jgi:hypothetical protein